MMTRLIILSSLKYSVSLILGFLRKINMKKLHNLILIFIILSLTACEKFGSETSIIGKWKLTETLADPGDGSGKWQSVSGSKYYLILNSDGSITGNAIADFKQYRIIDDRMIEFVFQNGTTTTRSYKLNSNSLEISGGCYEACGARYKK